MLNLFFSNPEVIFDLDYFKPVDNRYGYAASDVIAHFGGEEVVALLRKPLQGKRMKTVLESTFFSIG